MTKKWQPYPTYKDSGVEWLGAIPEHWEVNKLKNVAFINLDTLNEDIQPDYLLTYIDIGNVTSDGSILETQEFQFKQAPSRARRKVKNGDTIISTVRTYLRAISLIKDPPENLIVSTGFAVLSPRAEIDSRFLFRFVQSSEFVEKVVAHSEGVGYPAINPSKLACLPIWLPPLPEQQKIAEFLDQETSKIDKLITKKERLIKLLKEKRTALISHAVTKGLNPDVPMKDSGVEWLGEIPEHWEIVPLRSVLEQRIEYNIGRKTENILSVIKDVGVVNYEDREASGNKKSENIEQYKIIYPSDIVVNRMNLIFGSVGIAREYGASSTEYYVLKPKSNKVCQEYYGHIFCSKSFQLSLVGIGKGILFHRMRIYSEELKKILFPFPPLEEQKLINEYLIQNLNEINHLSDKLNTSIDHLKEYRTALISAAVTGKIDVREH
ncbi:restriction endonuclease subunit S [Microcystis aeruginosa BLCCF158]|uniref:Restriction endonuclease subunit S n=1 Tax=Microcystis aeruginosa BLCC-F158 TaxID=2755316 RepID=A0A841V5B0_MICAE|nr:restriction endonuclease subunit S [Microcystis aeruginosa]MBC1195406.1 restriction endonuclease subunit S [Microcystis aeruginosa BLCC-F158]